MTIHLFIYLFFIYSKKKSNAQIASGISGLDLLHETTMNSIEASNKDVSAPTGKHFFFHEKNLTPSPHCIIHENKQFQAVSTKD